MSTRPQNLIVERPDSVTISQPEISSRIILLQNTLPNYQSHLSTLRNQRNSLKAALIKAKDFEIVEPPLKPEYPIKPKKKTDGRDFRNLKSNVGCIYSLFPGILGQGQR